MHGWAMETVSRSVDMDGFIMIIHIHILPRSTSIQGWTVRWLNCCCLFWLDVSCEFDCKLKCEFTTKQTLRHAHRRFGPTLPVLLLLVPGFRSARCVNVHSRIIMGQSSLSITDLFVIELAGREHRIAFDWLDVCMRL